MIIISLPAHPTLTIFINYKWNLQIKYTNEMYNHYYDKFHKSTLRTPDCQYLYSTSLNNSKNLVASKLTALEISQRRVDPDEPSSHFTSLIPYRMSNAPTPLSIFFSFRSVSLNYVALISYNYTNLNRPNDPNSLQIVFSVLVTDDILHLICHL